MVIEEWHNFVKTKNINILDRILSEEVVFYSPAVHTPQVGKQITKKYLLTAAEVLFKENFKYVSEVKGNEIAICEFECNIDEIYINGIDIIIWNGSNQITSFKVMVRPLKGLMILKEKMANILSK
ncbi:MAG: hypothetical protein CMJ14_01560 [Pelagibacterales bacterium]|nr:hypothetical protein [Pelagibacterales bacterium]|tara:strand:- start:826 stop:1200 length:375 start_codon:yes stop_codon:yes gene_type:complete